MTTFKSKNISFIMFSLHKGKTNFRTMRVTNSSNITKINIKNKRQCLCTNKKKQIPAHYQQFTFYQQHSCLQSFPATVATFLYSKLVKIFTNTAAQKYFGSCSVQKNMQNLEHCLYFAQKETANELLYTAEIGQKYCQHFLCGKKM